MRTSKKQLRRVIREEIKSVLREQPDTIKVTDVEGNEHIVPKNEIYRIVMSGKSGGISGSTDAQNPAYNRLQHPDVEFQVVMKPNSSRTGEGAFAKGDIIGVHAEPA